MNKTLFTIMAVFMLSATPALAQQYRFPSEAEQQNACHKTLGTWRVLPPYCDNMHPRSWNKLKPEQQAFCMNTFNKPCDCGPGRRFSVVKVLGCIKSNFPEPPAE